MLHSIVALCLAVGTFAQLHRSCSKRPGHSSASREPFFPKPFASRVSLLQASIESTSQTTVPDTSDVISEESKSEQEKSTSETPSSLPECWRPGAKWQIVIDNPVDILKPLDPPDAQVWIVDFFHSVENPEIIPELKSPSAGIDNVVLCYVNIGAVQESESDFADFPSDAIGSGYDGYPEWWIDTSRSVVVELMKKRLAKAAGAGCDGIDGDNIDGWDSDGAKGSDKTGFGLTKADSVNYIKALSTYAHSLTTTRGLPLMFGQKNSQQLIPEVVDYVDFAVLEGCQGSGHWCRDFQGFVTGELRSDGAKLPVFDIEYPDSTRDSDSVLTQKDWEYYCNRDPAVVGNMGFSTIIKRGSDQLDGWVQYCEGDASRGVYSTIMIQGDRHFILA